MTHAEDFPHPVCNSPCSMKGVYDCEIIDQTQIATDVYRTRLIGPEIANESVPGQFVNVQVSKATDPLLRRPFSVHAVDPANGIFSLLYVVIGRGTELLKHIPPGEKVSVVGPLGRGFDLGDSPATHIVVAGGCGAAPLHFLCDALCARWGCESVTVLAGARTKDAVLCEAEFRAHGVEVGISTDDGSYGYRGFVTQLLEQYLHSFPAAERTGVGSFPSPSPGGEGRGEGAPIRVYSCGPHPMMREVARICREARVSSCQVSLENNMACGLGVCMGCVQKIREQGTANREEPDWRYERVCTDGPVFNAEDVIWE